MSYEKENQGYEGNFEDDTVNESKYEDGSEYNETAGTPRKTKASKSRNPTFHKSDLSSIDMDGDGKVSIEELNMKVTIEKAWQKFDMDGNGTIEAHELEDILDQIDESFLDENNLEEVLKELDSSDGDGLIDKVEFTNWILDKARGDDDGEQSELSKRLTAMAKKVTQSSKTDIHKASWENDYEIVKYFLDVDDARPKEFGETKLVNMPDMTGNEDGSNPDLNEGDSNTPLHYAAYQGHLKLCQLLVERGANVNATNGDGCTPLFLASQQNRLDVVKYLLKQPDCQLGICDKEYGLSAFDVAASEDVSLIFKSSRELSVPGPLGRPTIKPCSSEQKSQADVIVTFQPYSESDSYQKTYGGQLKGMDLPIRGYVVELSEKNKDQWDFRETLVADSTTDKLFDEFDANKDGGIARNELENFLLHVDKRFFDNMLAASGERCDMAKGEILDELFTELDADGSGIIDKREFIDYLRATNHCRISSAKKLKQKLAELEHKLTVPEGSDLSVRMTGLKENTKYQARVAVVNGIGMGVFSDTSRSARTWSRPQTIENVRWVRREATRVTLKYDPLFQTKSGDDEEMSKSDPSVVREILVVGQLEGAGKDTLFAYSMNPYDNDCTITVKKLKEGCKYNFKLIARNKCGTGAKSNAVSVETLVLGDNYKPIDLRVPVLPL